VGPVTQTVHNADGTVYGKYTAATYNGPDVFSAGYLGNDASQMFIDQSGLTYWAAPRGTTSTTSPNAATLQAARYLQLTAGPGMSGTAGRPANPLWSTTPTISDKSIYDWSEINLSPPQIASGTRPPPITPPSIRSSSTARCRPWPPKSPSCVRTPSAGPAT
jgi:hypothetical protein